MFVLPVVEIHVPRTPAHPIWVLDRSHHHLFGQRILTADAAGLADAQMGCDVDENALFVGRKGRSEKGPDGKDTPVAEALALGQACGIGPVDVGRQIVLKVADALGKAQPRLAKAQRLGGRSQLDPAGGEGRALNGLGLVFVNKGD